MWCIKASFAFWLGFMNVLLLWQLRGLEWEYKHTHAGIEVDLMCQLVQGKKNNNNNKPEEISLLKITETFSRHFRRVCVRLLTGAFEFISVMLIVLARFWCLKMKKYKHGFSLFLAFDSDIKKRLHKQDHTSWPDIFLTEYISDHTETVY